MPAEMSKQDVFNIVWRHFVTQEHPPGYERDMYGWACTLRTMQGDRCVLGLLIDDLDEYQKENGNQSSIAVAIEYLPWLTDANSVEARSFYRQLQEAHDQSCCHPTHLRGDHTLEFKNRITGRLRNIAFGFGLTVPPC